MGSRLPWTPEEDAIVLHGYHRGESLPLIASKLNRSQGGIRARLRLISDIPPMPAPIIKSDRIKRIRTENARRTVEAHQRSIA